MLSSIRHLAALKSDNSALRQALQEATREREELRAQMDQAALVSQTVLRQLLEAEEVIRALRCQVEDIKTRAAVTDVARIPPPPPTTVAAVRPEDLALAPPQDAWSTKQLRISRSRGPRN